MVWSFALRPDDAKQELVVYGVMDAVGTQLRDPMNSGP